MADQSVSVANMPDGGSPARVAFDLMARIATVEYHERGGKHADKPREYFLELFKECRKAVY